jgi:probable HAF family extracellular repeat protein
MPLLILSSLGRARLAVATILVFALVGCSGDGPHEPGGDAPRVIVDSPGAVVVVGTLGTDGWVGMRGRVTSAANLERLAYRVNLETERDIVITPGGNEASFDLAIDGLGLGQHTVSLHGYDKRGIPQTAVVTVHVVPAVRAIGVPAAAAHAYPSAINERGEVAGYWTDLETPTWHAFIHTGGQTRALGDPGELRSAAPGLNDNGDVVGYSTDAATGASRAMLWRGASATPLFAQQGGASAINNDGVVTGSIFVDAGPPRAFVYRNGTVTPIGEAGRLTTGVDVNAVGQVAGTSQGPQGDAFAFVFTNAMRRLGTLGGVRTIAQAMNDAGDVVGYAEPPDRSTYRAFVERNGLMRALRAAFPNDQASYAYDINNRRVVVGEMIAGPAGAADHWAFVATDGGDMRPIEELIGSGAPVLIGAYAISDRGEIVATAVSSSGWLRPVIIALPGGPEATRHVVPATLEAARARRRVSAITK